MNTYGLHRLTPNTVTYVFGPSAGNNTTYQKIEAPAAFTRVRVWHFSHYSDNATHWESAIAATETAADDTQNNRYTSIVSGSSYNSYGSPGFTRVTYSNGQTYGDMNTVQNYSSPNMRSAWVASDWMNISSVARTDGGTRPLLLLRTHHDSTQYGRVVIVSTAGGVTPFTTWATASAETFYRVFTGNASASTDGVGTLANMPSTSQVGATAYHTAIEFDCGVFTRSFYAAGDSITAGGGGQAYVFDAWNTRAILPLNSASKPVTFVNGGQSSQTSTTYLQTLADLIGAGVTFSDIILSGFSPNDPSNSVTNSIRQANLLTSIDLCKSIGARIYISTGCPKNYSGQDLTDWLDNNTWVRDLCTANGYIILDWAHLLESSLDSGQWGVGLVEADITHPSLTGITNMASTLTSAIPAVNVIVAAAGGGNWTTGATWVGGVAPTAADDVILDATSGNVTIDSGGAVCRSLDCVGGINGEYAGTLTHNAASTLSIGDASAGIGNIAIRMSSGMTYTLGNIQTSVLALVSTCAMQQSVTWNGKIYGKLSTTGVGGNWQIQDYNRGSYISFTNGTLDLNDQDTYLNGDFSGTGTLARTLYMGNGTVTLVNSGTPWKFTTATNLTFYAEGSTILFTDVTASSKTFQGGGLTYNLFNIVGGGAGAVLFGSTGGGCTFARPWKIYGGTKTLQLPASTTTIFQSGSSFENGNNIITIAPASATATIRFGERFRANYLNLTSIIADGSGIIPAYAGSNSTDGGGNTNWVFTAAPLVPGGVGRNLAIGLSISMN